MKPIGGRKYKLDLYLTGVKLSGKVLNVKLVEFVQIRRLFLCFYSLQLQNRLARIPGRAYNGLQ